MNQPNVRQFKAWCRANVSLAEAVVMAQAFAKVERERVDAYVLPIFAQYEFYNDLEVEHGGERERLARPKDLYLSKDEILVRDYFDACDQAHREHGFTGPKDHCPALRADNLRIQAERNLIEEGAKLFGINESLLYGEDGDKFLKLLLGACLNAVKEAA